MYNIATCQATVAEAQNTSSLDGQKAAANFFQLSAVTFNHLSKTVPQYFSSPPLPILSTESLEAIRDLMLVRRQRADGTSLPVGPTRGGAGVAHASRSVPVAPFRLRPRNVCA